MIEVSGEVNNFRTIRGVLPRVYFMSRLRTIYIQNMWLEGVIVRNTWKLHQIPAYGTIDGWTGEIKK